MAAGGPQDTGNWRSRAPLLLLLGAAVLAGHLVLLQLLPTALAPPDLARTRAFTTRSIVLPAAQAPAPAPALAAAPAPPPPRRKRARAAAAAPLPAPVQQPVATPAPAAEVAPAEPPAAPPPSAAEVTDAAAPEPAAPAEAAAPAGAGVAAGPPLALPGSARLKYTLSGQSGPHAYHALGELLWLQDGSSYDARLEYWAFLVGSRMRTSSGQVTAHGLEPTRFSDQWRKRHQVAAFDRAARQVRFSAGTPDAELLPQAQDQLSVLLQLASLLAGDPARYGADASITLPVVGPREAEVWTFTLHGEELLYLPYDQVRAVKVMRAPRRARDQQVEAWLAPSLGYLPVRVRITLPGGDHVDQQLRAIEPP